MAVCPVTRPREAKEEMGKGKQVPKGYPAPRTSKGPCALSFFQHTSPSIPIRAYLASSVTRATQIHRSCLQHTYPGRSRGYLHCAWAPPTINSDADTAPIVACVNRPIQESTPAPQTTMLRR